MYIVRPVCEVRTVVQSPLSYLVGGLVMLCFRHAFLWRRLCCHKMSVYLSVRLSVTRRYCVETVTFFHRQVARRYSDIPTGTSLIGASNTCEF